MQGSTQEYATDTYMNQPPDPKSNPDDDFFRDFRRSVPLKLQYFLRDSGLLRAIMNSLVLLGLPTVVEQYPSALYDFFSLLGNPYIPLLLPKQYQSESQLDVDFTVSYKSYGDDRRQIFSLLQPISPRNKNRLVVFVHGGAWGSGWPSMYQLMATPFLNNGYDFAVLGYRTYPSADYLGQISDLTKALKSVKKAAPNARDLTLIGHSSGAHIASTGFLNGKISKNDVDYFVSLSGIFDIPSHYQFERSRGIERISPMAAACGAPGKRLQGWKQGSPARRKEHYSHRMPESLLIHGAMDTIAPHTSTVDFSDGMRQSELRILPIGHAETVLQTMFGGATRDVVVDWLDTRSDSAR